MVSTDIGYLTVTCAPGRMQMLCMRPLSRASCSILANSPAKQRSPLRKDVPLREYQNIWGKNAGSVLTAQKPPARQHLLTEREKKEVWRLDWEEDGRWVEWRLDDDEQHPADRQRVQQEWTRYRDQRGRDFSKLWEDGHYKKSSFKRGSESWWREQYYEYEYTGQGGVQSMSAVREALDVLEVADAGDAGAIRKAYLRLVNKWHPDRFQGEDDKVKAAEMFRNVTDAYALLKERRDV